MKMMLRLAPCLGLALMLASCGGDIHPGVGGWTGSDAAAADHGAQDSYYFDPDVDNDGDGYTPR